MNLHLKRASVIVSASILLAVDHNTSSRSSSFFAASMYRLLFLGCVCSLVCASAADEPNFVTSPEEPPPKAHVSKWISEVFREAETAFEMDADASDACRRDFSVYKRHADNQTVWAVRMMESSEWPRVGIFSGMTTFPGNWDECLRARGPSDIQGRYCLAEASYSFEVSAVDPDPADWIQYPPENASAWNVIQSYDTVLFRLPRRQLTWALCIPSSCTAVDLQKSLAGSLRPLFNNYGMDIAVKVDPISCNIQKATNAPYSSGFIYTISLFTCLIVLVVSATTYHVARNGSEKDTLPNRSVQKTPIRVRLFESFSAVNSWRALTKYSSDSYTALYAVKCICLFWVIVGHRSIFLMGYPQLEQEQTEMMYKPWNFGLSLPAIVDIFFMISGFLTFHFGLTQVKKAGGGVFVLLSVISRWLRLMPTLGAFLLFFMFVVPYLGDGPFWNTRLMIEVDHCHSSWWAGLLAVNNMVNVNRMCLLHTWYITADMQLTIIGSLILFVLSKKKKIGVVLLIVTFLFGLGGTFYTIYKNSYGGIPIMAAIESEKVRAVPPFLYLHLQMFTKIGSYILGCLLALFVDTLKTRPFKLAWWQKYMLLSLVMVIGFGFQLYSFMFLIIGRPYNAVENALYGSLFRIFFVLPVCCYIGLNFLYGSVPVIDHLLSLKIFLPLGRLSYCAYLIHYPFQVYQLGVTRGVADGSSERDIALRSMCDLGYTFLMAFLFHLLMEGPLTSILQIVLSNIIRRLNRKPKVCPAQSVSVI